jgi:hypothetical protein
MFMQMDIEHVRTQHAVGQGSFHSAMVQMQTDDGRTVRFDYVYDCGALSGSQQTRQLTWALRHFRGRPATIHDNDARPVIDALVLSHFDRDHINGAEDLAKNHRIGRVFLPYLTPQELAVYLLHDIDISDGISDEYAESLAKLAHDRAMWGAPITRVGRGEEPPVGIRDAEPDPGEPESQRDRDEDSNVISETAFPAQIWDATGGSPIGHHLSHEHDVGVGTKPKEDPFWILRFWNYANSSPVPADLWNALKVVGCPVNSLLAGGNVGKILSWLAKPPQRKIALDVYKKVLRRNVKQGKQVPAQGLANLVSLALLSTPPDGVRLLEYSDSSTGDRPCCPWIGALLGDRNRGAWLGTGDAPLGKDAVWNDFAAHYGSALNSLQTFVVPHHGAAPASGHTFYNPALNSRPGMNSVISVGALNNYGHPRPEVIRQILGRGGRLHIVSEGAWPAYVEHATYTS